MERRACADQERGAASVRPRNHPDPPLTDIEAGPFPLGHLMLNNTSKQGSPAAPTRAGRFASGAKDGNFFVRIMLDATDGDNIPRHGETLVVIKGDELQLPPEYSSYKRSCDAKYKAYSKLKRATTPPAVERVPFCPAKRSAYSARRRRNQSAGSSRRSGGSVLVEMTIQQHYGPDALHALPFAQALHKPIK